MADIPNYNAKNRAISFPSLLRDSKWAGCAVKGWVLTDKANSTSVTGSTCLPMCVIVNYVYINHFFVRMVLVIVNLNTCFITGNNEQSKANSIL